MLFWTTQIDVSVPDEASRSIGDCWITASNRPAWRLVVLGLQAANPQAGAPSSTRETDDGAAGEEAQRFFDNGDYDRSAAVTAAFCTARPDDLNACELRTASPLFQLKKALGDTGARDKTTAWKQCAVCPALMSAFLSDTVRGQTLALARLTV